MAKKKALNNPSAQDILTMWEDATRTGLGITKKFEKAIYDDFRPRMLKTIQKRLDAGDDFNAAKANTLQVANDIGQICRMFTLTSPVKKATFVLAFTLARNHHPACPRKGGGGGAWCDEGG